MSRHADDDELKDARGTTRGDRAGKTVEFTPMPERRYAPKELINDRAKEEYWRVSKMLIDSGLIAAQDESLLIALCNETAIYHRMLREIEDDGITASPSAKADCEIHYKRMIKLCEAFGIGPANLSKIKPQKAKKKTAELTPEEQLKALRAS